MNGDIPREPVPKRPQLLDGLGVSGHVRFSKQLLSDILQPHRAGDAAVLVHDDRHVGLGLAEELQQRLDRLLFRHKMNRLYQPVQRHAGPQQKLAQMDHPDHIVDVLDVDGDLRQAVLAHAVAHRLDRVGDGAGDHVHAMLHDVTNLQEAQLHDLRQESILVLADQAASTAQVDQRAKLVQRDGLGLPAMAQQQS